MSYPQVVGTPPIPKKFLFATDIHEPRLSLGNALTWTILVGLRYILDISAWTISVGPGYISAWFSYPHVSWVISFSGIPSQLGISYWILWVWFERTNVVTHCPSKKLEAKCYSPFHIIKHVSPSTFKPVFHEALLTPYRPPLFSSEDKPLPPPPEVIVDGHVEYFVNSILDLKFVHGKPIYLVHWADTLCEDDTWKPLLNLLLLSMIFMLTTPLFPISLLLDTLYVDVNPRWG